MEHYIYLISVLLFLPLSFHILFKLKFQSLFKANNIWEIKLAYLLSSLIIAHLLATFIERFYLISINF